VLHNSNRLAVRLRPCETFVRIAPLESRPGAEFELEVARRLAATGAPVAELDPRVEPRAYTSDELVLTFWTYHAGAGHGEVSPAEYARALHRLHAAIKHADLHAPHFTARVAEAERLVGDRSLTPDLGNADRELLAATLRRSTIAIRARGAAEQLLHGEPHPGNVLQTPSGLLFIDLETCCRGPVEFDMAHVPDEVSTHYPEADQELLRDCRTLMLALIAAWRWDRDDQFPNGRRMGSDLLDRIRAAMA
jgi:Phosphotransferase enzyme family